MKMQIAELIQDTRLLRQELFSLRPVAKEKRVLPEEEQYKPRPFQHEIYEVEFKDGRKMRVRIQSVEERTKMYYRLKKIKATATFITRERVIQAMEDVRRAMIDAQSSDR